MEEYFGNCGAFPGDSDIILESNTTFETIESKVLCFLFVNLKGEESSLGSEEWLIFPSGKPAKPNRFRFPLSMVSDEKSFEFLGICRPSSEEIRIECVKSRQKKKLATSHISMRVYLDEPTNGVVYLIFGCKYNLLKWSLHLLETPEISLFFSNQSQRL
jgi:hypothetical protein